MQGLDRDQIWDIFEKAKTFKEKGPAKSLQDKTIVLVFEKASTRTRLSFETGISRLGGHPIVLTPGSSQMSRGEPLKDTARILSLYCSGIVMRTFEHERIEEMASWAEIPVINALTDLVHPCQVISDCFTLSERFGSIKNKKIAWIGDGNNMANSWINAAVLFGFDLDIACPKGYEPDRMTLDRAINKGLKIRILDDPIEAARNAICVNTDVWASMGQEDEHALRAGIFSPFQVNEGVMEAADDCAVFMHCLPAHRGQEVTQQVLEGEQSIIWEQAKNRLYVQEAIMDILFSE